MANRNAIPIPVRQHAAWGVQLGRALHFKNEVWLMLQHRDALPRISTSVASPVQLDPFTHGRSRHVSLNLWLKRSETRHGVSRVPELPRSKRFVMRLESSTGGGAEAEAALQRRAADRMRSHEVLLCPALVHCSPVLRALQ